MARTKVYIIDEVHMLSKQAFNGLLKTLEEPPDHVKFLFATTEIDKVPITVRSRCQRFDLRRVDSGVLMQHLDSICAREGVAIDAEALAILARAAEGSVRDALSLLDQAIAHGAGQGRRAVSADGLREMLGFADRSQIIDLFEALMRGAVADALGVLKTLYDSGADPGQVLVELAEFVHFVTRLKLVPDTSRDAAVTEAERLRGGVLAEALGMAVLTRTWQLLLKGLQEVKDSPRPLAAAEMILVRIAYAADLPTPDEALRRLAGAGSEAPAAAPRPAPAPRTPAPVAHRGGGAAQSMALPASPPPADVLRPRLARFEDLVALAAERRDIQMKTALERDLRLVRFEEGTLEFSLAPGASPQLAQTLMRKLQEWTGTRWMVALSSEPGAPSLKEQADAAAQAALTGVRADPLVQTAMALFPGAEITAVRTAEPALPVTEAPPAVGDEIAYADETYTEDDL
jgi:DNA polymerase-3 subunit gamma/tau